MPTSRGDKVDPRPKSCRHSESRRCERRGRRRRHCTNEGKGRSGNHDLAQHGMLLPFLKTGRAVIPHQLAWRGYSAERKLFLSQFLTKKSVPPAKYISASETQQPTGSIVSDSSCSAVLCLDLRLLSRPRSA